MEYLSNNSMMILQNQNSLSEQPMNISKTTTVETVPSGDPFNHHHIYNKPSMADQQRTVFSTVGDDVQPMDPPCFHKNIKPHVTMQNLKYPEHPKQTLSYVSEAAVNTDTQPQTLPDDPFLIEYFLSASNKSNNMIMLSSKSLEQDPSSDTHQILSMAPCARYKRDLSTASNSSLRKLFKIPRLFSLREYGKKSSAETSQWSLDTSNFESTDDEILRMVDRSFSTLSVTQQGKGV